MACLGLLVAGFSQASETHLKWFDGLRVGSGYNMDQMLPADVVAKNPAVRIESGSPEIRSQTYECKTARFAENGSELDLSLEGRYLVVHGKVSASSQSLSTIRSADYSLSIDYSRDFGRYDSRLSEPELADLRRLYTEDIDAFHQRYGTHYVTGERRHSYFRITYYVQDMSLSAAHKLNLKMSADGQFVLGSISGESSLQSVVKSLSTSSRLQVYIETNDEGEGIGDIVSDPSDAEAVRSAVRRIGNRLSSIDPDQPDPAVPASKPVANEFYVKPWEEVLGVSGGGVIESPALEKATTEYLRLSRLLSTLQGIGSSDSSYGWLGDPIVAYYQSEANQVESEMERVKSAIEELKVHLDGKFEPSRINVEFMVPPSIEPETVAGTYHGLNVIVIVIGAAGDFTAELRNGTVSVPSTSEGDASDPGGHKVLRSGPRPSDNKVQLRWTRDFGRSAPLPGCPYSNPLAGPPGDGGHMNYNGDWSVVLLDRQRRLILAVPLPQG